MMVEELLRSSGPESFGRKLRTLRAFKGMGQDDLAEKSGMNRASISLLENGYRQPRRSTIKKLATALGIEPEMLEE